VFYFERFGFVNSTRSRWEGCHFNNASSRSYQLMSLNFFEDEQNQKGTNIQGYVKEVCILYLQIKDNSWKLKR